MEFMELSDIMETKGDKLHSAIKPHALNRSFDLTKMIYDPCEKRVLLSRFFNNYHLQGGEFIKIQCDVQKMAGGPTDSTLRKALSGIEHLPVFIIL